MNECDNRVEWYEIRDLGGGYRERFSVVAEKVDGQWRFYDAESWEIRGFPVPGTERLRDIAEQKLFEQEQRMRLQGQTTSQPHARQRMARARFPPTKLPLKYPSHRKE